MAQFKVTFDHGENRWFVTKNAMRQSSHRKKSAAVSKARTLAKRDAKQSGYASLQINGEGGQTTGFHEYGEQQGSPSLF